MAYIKSAADHIILKFQNIMWCEQLLLWVPALVGFIFTIVQKSIPRWEFTDWNGLAEEAANPIVETWGSEERFDLMVLDDRLHLPPSVIWTPENPSQHTGYFSWIFTKVITTFSQLRFIMNTTFALATIVVILVACLGAIIYRLHLKKQAEKSYFTSLVQFMKNEAANGACEQKSVSDRLHWIILTQEAQIFEAMIVLMFEQENIRKMKSELTAKEERIQDLTSAIGDLGIEKAKIEDKSEGQATTIQQLSADLAETEAKKKNAEERSKLLELDMATAAGKADSKIRFLKADAEQLLVLIASQWSQLDDARTMIDANNEKVADLTLELSKHTEEISTINVSLDNASYRIEEVEKSATDLQSKVARRDATILRLKSKVTDGEKEIKLLQAAKEDSEARALEQKSKLKDENLRAANAKEKLEYELAKVRKENAAAVSQVSKGQKEIQKMKREVDEQAKWLTERDELTSNTCKEKALIEASLAEALNRVAEEGTNIRKKDEKYRVLESEMMEAKRDFQNSLAKEKNRLQLEQQQLESELLDKHNAKMTALKAKYDGIVEDTGARVKALEEKNIWLGDERDAQIAALNTKHGDIVQKVTSTFAEELTTVEDQNRRLKKEKEAVAKDLASMTKALDKEKAENKDKSPGADNETARIIRDLQASLATAGREAQEWRTEAYIAIVRRMPPSQRGLSLFNMDSRNFPGSHHMSVQPPNFLSSLPAGPGGHTNNIPSSRPPNPPASLPSRSPVGPGGHSNIVSSLPTPSHSANPSSGQSNANSSFPSSPQVFAGLNPAASEFRTAHPKTI